MLVKDHYSQDKSVTVLSALKLKPNITLVEEKLLTLQENLNVPPVVKGVHVAQSLVFSVMFSGL